MSERSRLLLASIIALAAGFAAGRLTAGPSSFHDCVLKNVRPGLSDDAVLLVEDACRSKFPQQQR